LAAKKLGINKKHEKQQKTTTKFTTKLSQANTYNLYASLDQWQKYLVQLTKFNSLLLLICC